MSTSCTVHFLKPYKLSGSAENNFVLERLFSLGLFNLNLEIRSLLWIWDGHHFQLWWFLTISLQQCGTVVDQWWWWWWGSYGVQPPPPMSSPVKKQVHFLESACYVVFKKCSKRPQNAGKLMQILKFSGAACPRTPQHGVSTARGSRLRHLLQLAAENLRPPPFPKRRFAPVVFPFMLGNSDYWPLLCNCSKRQATKLFHYFAN